MKQKNQVKSPKLPKGVSQQFVDGLQAMTTDSLKATIVTLQVQNQENETFKASDAYGEAMDKFALEKERFEQVAGPVKDLTVSIRNKTKLVVERLKEKGGA